MATQKIQSLVKQRNKTIERLLTTPANQLSPSDLRLLSIVFTFADSCYTKKVDLYGESDVRGAGFRDLNCTHSLANWDELCAALCLVNGYNAYDPVKVIEALTPHKNLIKYNQGENTQFGREYSPVLYLSLKNDFKPDFIPRVKALVKDMDEIAEVDSSAWGISGKSMNGNFKKEDLTWWACVRDDAFEIVSMEKREADYIGTLRFWWD